MPSSPSSSVGRPRSADPAMRNSGDERRAAAIGPDRGDGWLALGDDELLFRIESLPVGHARDDELLTVVRSNRHFFVRQEAAKRIADPERLKDFVGDRHIGQILARRMRREADVAYLEQLARESRHLEVRNAAQAQLRELRATLGLLGGKR
jgi:hypothetical protein